MEAVAILDDKDFHERWGWSDNAEQSRQKILEAIRILNERVKAFSVSDANVAHPLTGAS